MTIKEFSQKNSLVLFWTTVVLLVLVVFLAAATASFGRYGSRMMMHNRDGYGNYQIQNRRPLPYQKQVNQTPIDTGTSVQTQ